MQKNRVTKSELFINTFVLNCFVSISFKKNLINFTGVKWYNFLLSYFTFLK